MSDDLDLLLAETTAALEQAGDLRGWDAVRVATLGKNGRLTALLKELGKAPAEARRERGAALNRAKEALAGLIEQRRVALEAAALDAQLAAERLDVTLPPRPAPAGLIHPISRTMEEMAAIFGAMGFEIAEGPDIEDDWRNFGALNIHAAHPAREGMDTFYLPPDGTNEVPPSGNGDRQRVLRTHTSPVQVRSMLERALPFRVIVPGRTYRADHDATHSPMFHQLEGLVLDRDITLGHLKGCLIDFLRAYFRIADLPVRFRASYFPFTEPSMEVDIGWNRKIGRARHRRRLAGDPRQRDGASQGARQLRHRSARVAGLCLRDGHRARDHAEARHHRSPPVL